MTQVFIFKDDTYYDFEDHETKIVYIDINEEIKTIENDNWNVISVQHNIIPNFYKNYNRWDRNIFTVIAKKENNDE